MNEKTMNDFIVNGKGRPQGTFMPPDVEQAAAIAALESGLRAKHLASGILQFLVFTGVEVEAPGEGDPIIPVAATLTGAIIGATVAGVINFTDGTDAADKFETTITEDDKILQIAVADYTTKKFLVILIN